MVVFVIEVADPSVYWDAVTQEVGEGRKRDVWHFTIRVFSKLQP